MPEFTIIIATYNVCDLVESAICSVLNQIFKDYEIIVIDGGSSDGTLDILSRYKSNFNYFISEPDNGIYDAWNKGINKARGDWILFVGADDELLPDCLLNYSLFIKKSAVKFDFISSKVKLTKKNSSQIVGECWSWKKFKRYMNVAHVGSIHNRNIFTRYGCFDINYKICGDYEFLLRANKNLKAGYFDSITAQMGSFGVSSKNIKVFHETFKAKITTGKCSYILSIIDFCFAILKWKIKNLIYE